MPPIIRYCETSGHDSWPASITNARWNNTKSEGLITQQLDKNRDLLCGLLTESQAPVMTHPFLYLSYQIYSCYTWKPTHLIIQIWCDSQKWQPAQEENQPSVTSDCEAQSALALLAFASLVKFPAFPQNNQCCSLCFHHTEKSFTALLFVWIPYESIFLISAVHGPLAE